jgi:hypothetical protein
MALLQHERETTRYLFLSNILDDDASFWTYPHYATHAIRSVLQTYVEGNVEVFCHPKKLSKYCHLGLRSAIDARKVMAVLQDQRVKWEWTDHKG